MSRTIAARKLRSIHSKNFYKELDNFSTASMNKMKRRKIYLFSDPVTILRWKGSWSKKNIEGRLKSCCLSLDMFSLHSFLWIYICTSKKARFFIFWKGKRVNLRENVNNEQGVCLGLSRSIAKKKFYNCVKWGPVNKSLIKESVSDCPCESPKENCTRLGRLHETACSAIQLTGSSH